MAEHNKNKGKVLHVDTTGAGIVPPPLGALIGLARLLHRAYPDRIHRIRVGPLSPVLMKLHGLVAPYMPEDYVDTFREVHYARATTAATGSASFLGAWQASMRAPTQAHAAPRREVRRGRPVQRIAAEVAHVRGTSEALHGAAERGWCLGGDVCRGRRRRPVHRACERESR